MSSITSYKDWVGRSVCVYEPYANSGMVEEFVKVCTLTGVGTKYITAGGVKFDKETLCNGDIGVRKLFLGTPAELSEYLSLYKLVRRRAEQLYMGIDRFSPGELRRIYDIIKEI